MLIIFLFLPNSSSLIYQRPQLLQLRRINIQQIVKPQQNLVRIPLPPLLKNRPIVPNLPRLQGKPLPHPQAPTTHRIRRIRHPLEVPLPCPGQEVLVEHDHYQLKMNYKEEQEQEIEALKVIFLDEFHLTYEQPYKFELTIHTDRDEDELNFIKIQLLVEFPEKYPEVPPKASFKNLSESLLEPSEFHRCEEIF